MSPLLLLVVLLVMALATFRITWLLVVDEFPPILLAREWIVDRWGDSSWQGYLATCVWCVSMYVAAAVVAGVLLFTDLPLPVPVLVWWALSGATGIIASRIG